MVLQAVISPDIAEMVAADVVRCCGLQSIDCGVGRAYASEHRTGCGPVQKLLAGLRMQRCLLYLDDFTNV
jgi:short subunit dehydrogenase-like uncharacterized protein